MLSMDSLEKLKECISKLENSEIIKNKKQNDDGYLLSKLDNSVETTVILLKWIQHIVANYGKEQAKKLFPYYCDIKWISEDVLRVILKFLDEVDIKENSELKSIEKVSEMVTIHLLSLYYISFLRGEGIDLDVLCESDLEIKRLRKFAEDMIKKIESSENKK
ncbi:MAG: archaeal flagellar protein FlaD [Methanothermococcus sp.]|uniref:FlaD/FlaE family flagellar protein n=1 Tax=Methanothermococcus TaxID=155862 RepID=UPI000378041D|nr:MULTISPECIES: FlaD/FlaE family flagellar protein [Methanothermococcus]MDK2790319.1 archaeal flagellar protein FlaD [Methanothermococcus sp.]MDK2987825.1 archaeal flagellar protein FlaD [Methanothermococcus sp.]